MKAVWHYSESRKVAGSLGFSRGAALCIAIGNVSVDLRHWKRDYAHGMTSMDPDNGRPTLAVTEAERDWRAWIDVNVNRARRELETGGDCRVGFYFLGMALHAVQDVEAHAGMTNAEHARRYLNRTDPDLDRAALERGQSVTLEFLADFVNAGRKTACAWQHGELSPYMLALHPPDGARVDMDPVGFLWQGIRWLRREPPVVRWPCRGVANIG